MIDFKKKKFEGNYGNDEEYKKLLADYTKTIQKDLAAVKTDFFYLGVHLIDLYNSNTYSITFDREQLRIESNLAIGVGNCCSECFFAYCYEKFGLDKTQVSRYMNIVDEFGEKLISFDSAWNKYSYSQLCELLPLTPEQRKPVKPSWTIKKIREYKKSLVATSQQEEMDLPEAELPPDKYSRFEKWTKAQLCDKIFELESERETLLNEIEALKSASLDKAGYSPCSYRTSDEIRKNH